MCKLISVFLYESFPAYAFVGTFCIKNGIDCTYFYQFVIKKFIVMRVVLSFKASAAKLLLVFPRTTTSALRNYAFYQMSKTFLQYLNIPE